MTPTPFYMTPETSRQLLELSRENNAKRRIERELRQALVGFTDSAWLEFWPLRNETHIVSITNTREVRNVGVLWI
jgi:hypothetical protein